MNEGLSVQDLKCFALQLLDGQEEAVKAAGMRPMRQEAACSLLGEEGDQHKQGQEHKHADSLR